MVTVRPVERALIVAPRTGGHVASRFADSSGWTSLCGRYVPGRRATVHYGQAGVDWAVANEAAMCPECARFAYRTAADLPQPLPTPTTRYDLLPYWLRTRP